MLRLGILDPSDLYVCNDWTEVYARDGYRITRRVSKFE